MGIVDKQCCFGLLKRQSNNSLRSEDLKSLLQHRLVTGKTKIEQRGTLNMVANL